MERRSDAILARRRHARADRRRCWSRCACRARPPTSSPPRRARCARHARAGRVHGAGAARSTRAAPAATARAASTSRRPRRSSSPRAACASPSTAIARRARRCGSADVLEALGVDARARRRERIATLHRRGRHRLHVRARASPGDAARRRRCARELGVRTLFNCARPARNPAGATHQLLGVYDDALRRSWPRCSRARRAAARGSCTARAASTRSRSSGPTRVTELARRRARASATSRPATSASSAATPTALRGGDAAENAGDRARDPRGRARRRRRDAVVVNAAAALCVGRRRASSPREAAARAADAIDSGAARAKLATWVAFGAEAERSSSERLPRRDPRAQARARSRGGTRTRALASHAAGARRVDDRAARSRSQRCAARGARAPRVIAEIKLRSPSAGAIRARSRGGVQAIARGVRRGGRRGGQRAVRRAGLRRQRARPAARRAQRSTLPLLFKEFVLDRLQLELARAVGAHMVLLLVRALDRGAAARARSTRSHAQGIAPVVEAADDARARGRARDDAPRSSASTRATCARSASIRQRAQRRASRASRASASPCT